MSEDIIEKTSKHIMNTYKRLPLVIKYGSGAILHDDLGNAYIDMTSGLGAANLGHANEEIAEALYAQARTLVHVSNIFFTKPQALLAAKLCEICFGERVFFCNSGAEANEAAIKLARKYAKVKGNMNRYKIVSAMRGFHGRTLATLAATGQPDKQTWFAPMPAGFGYAEFNNIDSFANAVDDETCAVIIELVQGEGGVNIAEPGFAADLAELCHNRDLLLIVDEVQTGFGRTGRWFAYEHYGITPDVMTVAKGLGNGLPIGAVIAGPKASDIFEPGDHATTFGGSPLISAGALKVLEIIERDNIPERSARLGQAASTSLSAIACRHKAVREVRGQGMMMALDLNLDKAGDVVQKGLKRGIIVNATGPSTIRLLPPLIISEDRLDHALSELEKTIAEIEQEI